MKRYFGKHAAFARKRAGFTQEAAADDLCVSSRMLAYYEHGIVLPPDDIVSKMMEMYNAPQLGHIWLRCNLVGQKLLVDIVYSTSINWWTKIQKQTMALLELGKEKAAGLAHRRL